MKRILAVLSLTLLVLAAAPEEAHAQLRSVNQIGVHVGYDIDVEEPLLGAQYRFQSGVVPFILSASADYYLVDDVTFMQFNLDGLWAIGAEYVTMFQPYVGAGLGLQYWDVDVEGVDSDTNLKINALAGGVFGSGSLRPFAEARLSLLDDTQVLLRGGILFTF